MNHWLKRNNFKSLFYQTVIHKMHESLMLFSTEEGPVNPLYCSATVCVIHVHIAIGFCFVYSWEDGPSCVMCSLLLIYVFQGRRSRRFSTTWPHYISGKLYCPPPPPSLSLSPPPPTPPPHPPLVGFLAHRHNCSMYCEVVGHPPAPLHEGQWPKWINPPYLPPLLLSPALLYSLSISVPISLHYINKV